MSTFSLGMAPQVRDAVQPSKFGGTVWRGKMNYFLKRLAGLAVIMLFVCGVTFAQVDTGTVGGTVTDTSNALVAGATVTFRSLETDVKRTVETSANGTYTVTGLSTGTYEVTANAAGFQPFTTKVEVTVG